MRTHTKTRYSVLRTLYQIQVKHNRTFSWVKRSTIQKYLNKYYGIKVCLSTISYHLWKFNREGLIRTYTRYRHNEDGTFDNLPSNRQITGRGIRYLMDIGINVVKWLYNWAFKGIKPVRYKDISNLPYDKSIKTRPPRGTAGPPETFENVLLDTLNSLK